MNGAVIRALDAGGEGSVTRFEISISSETPCSGWFGDEILVHTPEAVDLTRLREVGALLFAHGRDTRYGVMPVGGIESVELDVVNHRCVAVVGVDEEDPLAMEVGRKMERGYLSGVSIGFSVAEWVCIPEGAVSADGRFAGPVNLATKWTPFEISIEPTPADPSVGVGRSATYNQTEEDDQMPGKKNNRKKAPKDLVRRGAGHLTREEVDPVVDEDEDLDEQMEDEIEKAIDDEMDEEDPPETELDGIDSPEDEIAGEGPVTERAMAAGRRAERARVDNITRLCRSFGIRPDRYIRGGDSVSQVKDAILRQLGKERAPLPGTIRTVKDEMDKFAAAATDSLLIRAGMTPKEVADGARDLRGIRLRDLAIDVAARSGVTRAHRMDNERLFREVLTPDSAFVGIVTNAVQKSMAVAYEAAPPTYPLWTSKGSNPDFKPKLIVQISEAGDLEEVPQNGELKMDHPTDGAVTSVLATFGKTFGFTRQALINDDIDMLTKLPAAYVRAALRGTNKAVYNVLASNPAMADGQQLFSAAHGNLGAAAKPSVASYNAAMAAMMRQKGLRGKETLNIRPAFVLCDPIQYVDHATILASAANPDVANAGVINPFRGMMRLVMDAELVNAAVGNAFPYFFVADPMSCGGIEVSYLNGNEEPTLDFEVGFDYLGIKYRIIYDRGVTLLDYRGLFKNPGINE